MRLAPSLSPLAALSARDPVSHPTPAQNPGQCPASRLLPPGPGGAFQHIPCSLLHLQFSFSLSYSVPSAPTHMARFQSASIEPTFPSSRLPRYLHTTNAHGRHWPPFTMQKQALPAGGPPAHPPLPGPSPSYLIWSPGCKNLYFRATSTWWSHDIGNAMPLDCSL